MVRYTSWQEIRTQDDVHGGDLDMDDVHSAFQKIALVDEFDPFEYESGVGNYLESQVRTFLKYPS